VGTFFFLAAAAVVYAIVAGQRAFAARGVATVRLPVEQVSYRVHCWRAADAVPSEGTRKDGDPLTMRDRRNWIELVVTVAVFALLTGIVWVTDAPRELLPAVWMGGVIGIAGADYWRERRCLPRPPGSAGS
jgi:hypothetical protein